MKKFVILSVLVAMASANANAQLKVDSIGNVSMMSHASVSGNTTLLSGLTTNGVAYFKNKVSISSSLNMIPSLSVGNNCYYGAGNIGIAATSKVREDIKNIGIEGYVNANSSFSSDSNYGLLGMTSINTSHGRNYGVAGILALPTITNNMGGAGIYAADYQYHYSYPENIPGVYAAYIHGKTYLNGAAYVTEIYYPSDDRLNRSVESMGSKSRGEETTLEKLLKLNVIEYNAKSPQEARASYSNENMTSEERQAYEYMKKENDMMNARQRFGLSGQDLQKIYPNLVVEGQDGYLYVNYVELVPVLIRSIQELKAELEDVRGSNGEDVGKARAANHVDVETDEIDDATAIPVAATLSQNTPNPFSERTTIRFSLPENAKNAFIYIFDMSGKMQKQVPVNSSMQSITIEGYELSAGMYIYSLVIGGKEVQTRRMILSK